MAEKNPIRVTLDDIEGGVQYDLRPGQTQYEAYPGGWLTMAPKATIGLAEEVGALAYDPARDASVHASLLNQAKRCTTAPEDFNWEHPDMDSAVLRQLVSDFLLRSSAGMLRRPPLSSAS